MTNRINHLAVFVAAIAYFAWGGIYFTIFSNQWLALTGLTKAEAAPALVPYVCAFLMGWLFSYGAAIALGKSKESSAADGIQFAIFMCIVFYASTVLTESLFEQRSIGLWAFDSVYVIVGQAIACAIVGGWRAKA
jgi:hypothetical protein